MHKSASDDQAVSQILLDLDERITGLERRVFGDEINSKIQGKRQIIDELIQINSQLNRSLSNRETVLQLMKSVEEILDLIQLEDSTNASQIIGCESKANAILLAEPIIKQMHQQIRNINIDEANDAINSKDIRDIIPLKDELVQLKFKQLEELESPNVISSKIEALTEAIDALILNATL